MFVRHSVHIEHPVDACTEALMGEPRKWFPRLSGKGVGSVGVHIGGLPVSKRVVVTLGDPVTTTTWTVIPFEWKATFPEQLFPKGVAGTTVKELAEARQAPRCRSFRQAKEAGKVLKTVGR